MSYKREPTWSKEIRTRYAEQDVLALNAEYMVVPSIPKESAVNKRVTLYVLAVALGLLLSFIFVWTR